jgi:hypothetical protein
LRPSLVQTFFDEGIVQRWWPILVWIFVISAFADHPVLETLPGPESYPQQEVFPLALQYRLEVVNTLEEAHDACDALQEPYTSSSPVSEVADARHDLVTIDPLYRYLSLRL